MIFRLLLCRWDREILVWGELTRRSGSNMTPTWSVNGGLVLKWGGASRTTRERMKALKKTRTASIWILRKNNKK